MKKIKSALISVYYKDGLERIVRKLAEDGVAIYSTGGTLSFIESLGLKATSVESLTGYPSILGGRVKTLHPKVFGGILARRDNPKDSEQAAQYEIPEIDAVIVGCDRVARNYDFANKTGTLSLAVNAKYFGVPFYVAAPSPTFDDCCATGADIVIEQRPGGEVTEQFFSSRKAPEGIGVYNPAFDVIPHTLVSAFITEKGVIRLG